MSSKNVPDPPASRGWSLATQLTLWYAASSFVLLAASAVFMYRALVHNLESEDDQFMIEKVQIVQALLRGHSGKLVVLPGESSEEKVVRTPTMIFLRVVNSAGEVLLESAGMAELLPGSLFPTVSRADASTGKVVGQERWLSDGRCFRLAAVHVPGEASEPVRLLQVAMDRTREEEVLVAYRRNLMLVLGLSLLCCTVLGYRIARHGIRPLEAIAATAGHIRSSNLAERIALIGLPAELRTLADTFNAMLDRLEQSFVRLRQFSADIAHELRTPVNNLRGEIEVALSKPRNNEEYREVLGSGLEECGRLTGMIDSLLFLARAENPRTPLDREPLDVMLELERVREYYEVTAAEAGITLAVTSGPGVTADLNRSLFHRAVANLVANALAHTPRGGKVTLIARRESGTLQVEVADSGQGIEAKHLAHVFERFYRADSARTSRHATSAGMGLGLAIVRGIVEMHGGSVAIRSEVDQGTTVVLNFPDRS